MAQLEARGKSTAVRYDGGELVSILGQIASVIFGTNDDSYFSASNGAEVLPNMVLRERHRESVRVTEQPVEIGAAITDHSFNEPTVVTLSYGYSNACIMGFISDFEGGIFNHGINQIGENYVRNVYQKLIAIKQNRYLCKVVTYKRVYNNMIIEDIETETDPDYSFSMILHITMKELFLIGVNAKMNGGIQNNGTKQLMNVSQVPNFGSV